MASVGPGCDHTVSISQTVELVAAAFLIEMSGAATVSHPAHLVAMVAPSMLGAGPPKGLLAALAAGPPALVAFDNYHLVAAYPIQWRHLYRSTVRKALDHSPEKLPVSATESKEPPAHLAPQVRPQWSLAGVAQLHRAPTYSAGSNPLC